MPCARSQRLPKTAMKDRCSRVLWSRKLKISSPNSVCSRQGPNTCKTRLQFSLNSAKTDLSCRHSDTNFSPCNRSSISKRPTTHTSRHLRHTSVGLQQMRSHVLRIATGPRSLRVHLVVRKSCAFGCPFSIYDTKHVSVRVQCFILRIILRM